jgi:hypothetical protein
MVALNCCGAIIHTSQQGAQTMFKYTVQARLNKQPRVAVLTIKSPVDYDVGSKKGMDGFLALNNVVRNVEKIFGEGCVDECVMADKSKMIQHA